ncbi:MAG TPA: TonB-dependent receptor [Bryobacteraceae bacterium]
MSAMLRDIFPSDGTGSTRIVAAVCAITLVFAAHAWAQGGGNAAITGTVTDPTGAVVVGANVSVTQEMTQVKRTAVTNQSGQFNVPSLPPATYHVAVEAPGFKSFAQDLTLLADQIGDLPIRLSLGQATETISVEATSAIINTVTPVLSQVIDRARVVELPLNGRNAADLTLLVPGAVNANGHGVQQGSTKQIPGTESIAVNGARPDQISYNLDGANNEDLMSNTNNPFPFPDAVQEFSVQTNSFDAQYGTNAGAVVNVVTKSGTNSWHGDAFEFLRNREFNARNFFANTVDPLKRNQFGGTAGGPIRKDTTFLFLGYQGTRIRTLNNAQNTILPTPANMQGDFSNYLSTDSSINPKGKVVHIVDPATGLPYPGNVGIPVSPVAAAMAQFLPISEAAANGRITYGTANNQNFNEGVARFDQIVRGQDKLYGRFYLDRYEAVPPYDGKNLLTIGTGSTVQTQNYAVGYTWVPGPRFVNETVLNFVRAASVRTQGGNVPQFTDFGATVSQLPQSEGGIRGFGIAGGYFGVGNFTDGRFIRNIGEIRNHAVWTYGNHTISFGGSFERDQSNIRNTDFENGNWQFTDDLTNLALAGFVMGHLHSFSQTSGNYSDQRQNVVGLYLQDNWKARPNLSLTLGLRWEPQGVMKEIYGRTEQFRPDAYAAGVHSVVIPSAPAGLFFVGDTYNTWPVPETGQTADINNFAPRAGIAWTPFGSRKTVIRAGGGVFYSSRLPGLFLNDASITQPFSLRADLVEPNAPNNLIPFNNPVQSIPAFAAAFPERYVLSNVPPDVKFTAPVAVFSLEPARKWVTPTLYDWNFTIEQQLRSDTLFQISYVGTRGVHLREDVDLNPRAAGIGTERSRPYQPFSDILENQNNGMSNYNALQVNLEKRPGGSNAILKNMTLLVNYTFSKAMDIALANNGGTTDVGSSKGSGMPYGNPFQGRFDTGPSDFDRTHRFVASFVWELPRLMGAHPAVRMLLGGWQWTGIVTHSSGDAITILAGTDQSKTNLGGDRAYFIGPLGQYGGVAPESQRSGCGTGACVPWLNTSLFALPAVGTFGNVGKGAFRGPGITSFDTGLSKNFYPLASDSSLRIQLRGEFFNVLNHPIFNDPELNRNSGNFGGIRAAADPRIIQLALKVFF